MVAAGRSTTLERVVVTAEVSIDAAGMAIRGRAGGGEEVCFIPPAGFRSACPTIRDDATDDVCGLGGDEDVVDVG